MNTDKEFVPYQQSLDMKELGFDEPSISGYSYPNSDKLLSQAILYQQAFRWFREKYGLYHYIIPEFYINGINFNWQVLWYLPKEEWTDHNISDGTFMYGDNGEYPTQESAESACLDKLIEIVRNTKS